MRSARPISSRASISATVSSISAASAAAEKNIIVKA
jgi:hypothetical protein